VSSVRAPELLPVAVRGYAVPITNAMSPDADEGAAKLPPWTPRRTVQSAHRHTLVFDTETTTDPTQRLLFGSWQLYLDEATAGDGLTCTEEGVFFADDLPERDPAGFATIQAYAATQPSNTAPGYRRKLRLLSRTEFVEQLLWRYGYRHQATIVGFNLPFDLARLAVHASRARGRNRGGISLRLWEHNGGDNQFRPRVVVRSIDRHRSLIQFTTTSERGQAYRGKFLDLHTLAFAHTDRGHSLEAACDAFAVPYTKRDVTLGLVGGENITYCREDVTATAQLYRALMVEHRRHRLPLPAHRAFSPATLGRSYWHTMGLRPTADRLDGLPDEINGWGMEAFYGGRAECRIRRTDVPVTYVDFRSMYMTCNALMGTWPLLITDRVTLTDATAEVRRLLVDPNLAERCFDPATWAQLHTLVQVEADGAVLPVRAAYDPTGEWGIGVNPYWTSRPQWYALGDVLAAGLLGDPTMTVLQAWRLNPGPPRDGLSTARLLDEIEINPIRHDFFAACVEHRTRTATSRRIRPDDRARLQRFLKVLANASGYGTLVQFNRGHEIDAVPVRVHSGGETFDTATRRPETPGEFCWPPVAACITAAARLMLALLEHEVTEAGGTFAFCDTDSMAIVAAARGGLVPCPGGPHRHRGATAVRALSWKAVGRIVDRFAALNPYDPAAVPGSILRIEDENYRPAPRRQRELRCFAISAKRYSLNTTTGESTKDPSEHGLGHLQNPLPEHPKTWVRQAWQWLQHPTGDGPAWLDLPALSKMTVSSPDALAWFAHHNKARGYPDSIKPGNFLLVAHPDPHDPPAQAGVKPVAPYHHDPDAWDTFAWIDRTTSQPLRLRTGPLDGIHRAATVRVLTYRDVLARYLNHPEAKATAPDSRPCGRGTIGVLARRPVRPLGTLAVIGKEANDLDSRATGDTSAESATLTYTGTEPDWMTEVLPALRCLPTAVVATRTGLNRRTVQRALTGRTAPHPRHRQPLLACAIAHARGETGFRTGNDRAALQQLLRRHAEAQAGIRAARD
jgi:hypothetical protein